MPESSTALPPRPAAAEPPRPLDAPPPAGRPGLLRGGLGLLALRVVGLGLSVGTAVLLARQLGTAGFGRYENALAWLILLAVPAGLGAEKLVVRGVAAGLAGGEHGRVRSLLRGTRARVAGAAATLAAVAAGAILLGLPLPAELLVVLPALPALALLRIEQALLQGLHRVVRAWLPELVVVPALLAGLLLATIAVAGDLEPTAALLCHGIALATAAALATVTARRHLPDAVRHAAPSTASADWWHAAAPLLVLAVLQTVNARIDVLVLGALTATEEVGRYGAANRVANLITMVLLAANGVLAPVLAREHALGVRGTLQATVTRCARFATAGALPLAAGMILLGGPVLACFGSGFAAGDDVLAVLAAGQLANVALGPVGLILVMTGHAGAAARGFAAGAAVNLGLDLVLIPDHGALGAAWAHALATVTWNAVLAVMVWRRLGVHSTVLGRRA